MEINDYLRILRKRGYIIILVALIAGASAYAVSKMQTPIYSATVKLSVVPARATDWGSSNSLKDLLRNYAENITTHGMAADVIDREQLDMDTGSLLGKLFVSPDSSTFTLALEARDRDPKVAMDIVNQMSIVFIEDRDQWNQRQDKRDRIDVSMLDSVYNLGYQQYTPQTSINTLAAAIFGTLMGLLVIVLLEWLEMDIIRTPSDIERAIDNAVLGTIPPVTSPSSQPRQKGSSKLVPKLGGTNS
ncbi:Wzz/FepE/Etk N-terminal domain-containing protein [Anaerolineales bacterium HSG24]|nr:Wzz/FepE/Etk N-terminal domain-containing protein [Anaerolineales bacterium HSG24]